MSRNNYNHWTAYKTNDEYVKCSVCGSILVREVLSKTDQNQGKKARAHCSYMKCNVYGGMDKMIKLDKKYILKASSLGWDIGTIEPRKQKDDSIKEVFVGELHYGRLIDALKGYVKLKQMDADKAGKIESFTDLFKITQLIEKKIENLYGTIEKELRK